MDKALIIIPYFGKLPNWFQPFLNSCSSELLDFLLITDDRTEYYYPSNFQVVYSTFDDFKIFFTKDLDREILLETAYKLCDYKPLYGKVFSEYVMNYKFWGYCDIDIIFGDIDYFLRPFFEKGFDKLFQFGHLSIYRNSPEINQIYTDERLNFNFEFVRNTTLSCNFDEVSINEIFIKTGKKYIPQQLFENVNMNNSNFAIGNGLPLVPQLIVKINLKLFICELIDGIINYREILYIHFMWRSSLVNIEKRNNNYIICKDGLVLFEDEKELYSLFLKYGLPADKQEDYIFSQNVKKKLRKRKVNALFREVKVLKLRSIYNVAHYYILHKIWKY